MNSALDLSYISYFKNRDLTNCLDPLCGILNRQTIMDYAEYLANNGREFSLFLIDVDNFKNVNDTYGHTTGDKVIVQTAQAIADVAMQNGVMGRYGGDEFIVVYENAIDYQQVWQFGSMLTHKHISEVNSFGTANISVTLTIGIARFPLDAKNFPDLFVAADKALYRGKSKGRHCFVIYLPEKHAGISLIDDREKKQSLMQLSMGVFNNLTAFGENISDAITTVFKSFVSYFMFDHICIETPLNLNFSVIHPHSVRKTFRNVPYSLLVKAVGNADYSVINEIEKLNPTQNSDLIMSCSKQGIMSALYCRISAYGKNYGFIRVDTTNNSRIWQNDEVSMVIVAAKTIGIILHYQGTTLEQLPAVAPLQIQIDDGFDD